MAKFGNRVLRRLASSLSNVISQVGRQTKTPVQVTFFKIQYMAFGYYLVVLNATIFGIGSAETIP